MDRRAARDGVAEGLLGALFPARVVPAPPPETEIAELLTAPDLEAWAIEHEVTRDGHECEDLVLHYRDEAKPAVYCPRCRLLVGAQEWRAAVPAVPVVEPTHLETARMVLRANVGTGALLAVMAWLASLGFTTPGVALLVAVGVLIAYARASRDEG